MKYFGICSVIFLLLSGCATYKHLKPDPELSNAEKGYIELKRKGDPLKIKEEKKYFIQFPSATDENFYLVIKSAQMGKLGTYFTGELVKKKSRGNEIKDETHAPDTLAVYPITKSGTPYFWLLETVPEDMELDINYRYVPQWRFLFENKSAEFKAILKKNRVEQKTYHTIGSGFQIEAMTLQPAIDSVTHHLGQLTEVHKQLLAIESIFPSSILNSQDRAYQDYLMLKKELEAEMAFQTSYLNVLTFFSKERASRGNPQVFLANIDFFDDYAKRLAGYPNGVKTESQGVLNRQRDGLITFFDKLLARKRNIKPWDPQTYRIPAYKKLPQIYNNANLQKSRLFDLQHRFVVDYDKKSKGYTKAKTAFDKVENSVMHAKGYPDFETFPNAANKLDALDGTIPKAFNSTHAKYMDYPSPEKLSQSINALKSRVNRLQGHYREAASLVRQVLPLQLDSNYSEMLGILKGHSHLGFLMDKYAPLDEVSINTQAQKAGLALRRYAFNTAEAALFRLQADRNFINYNRIKPLKKEKLDKLEDSLYIKVDRISRKRVNDFCEANFETLDDVDALYNDTVFLPAHDIRFSSGGKAHLYARKDKLIAHLAKMKENEFPAKAVKLLYKSFIRRPGKYGVKKARAVVTHGKHYKGDEKKVKRAVAECNPWLAKWIVQPAKYRRVFAFPINQKRRNNNTYVLRLNIRIETEAKFPVYDVNVKLPKAVAQKASTRQWYEKITLNKVPLKNEGRFTISAPTAKNNYESQITPVRMKAEKSNLLEIRFKNPGWRPFPVSVMVQKPIIKKN